MDKNLKICYFCRNTLKPDVEPCKEFEGCSHKLMFCSVCFDKSLEISVCPFCSSAPKMEDNNEEFTDLAGPNLLLLISLNFFSTGIPMIAYDSVQNEYQGPFYLSQSSDSKPFIPSVYSGVIQEDSYSFIISGGILKTNPSKCKISNEIILLNFLKDQNFQFYEIAKTKILKHSRYSHCIFQFGNKLILVGGFTDSVGNFSKTTEILDGNWESKEGPLLNSNRTQFQGFFLDSYLYIFGGFSGEEKIENSFERLDIASLQKWEPINYKNQEIIKGWCSSFVLSNISNQSQEIYILGGYDGVEKKGTNEKIMRIKNNEVSEIGNTEFSEINAVGFTYDQNFALLSVKDQLNIEFRKRDTFEYLGTQGIKIEELNHCKLFKPEEKWFFIN